MSEWDAESLINTEAIDALSEEDLKRLLEMLTEAGY